MACDTWRRTPQQTMAERVAEVRRKTQALADALVSGRVKVKVGQNGAVVFVDWQDRAGITDACAYRRIMAAGGQLAQAKIKQAELMSGRKIDQQAVARGVHSHDGGTTWHDGH